jgi:ABC-type uncharacterized transport system substrate-binding protein
VIKNAIDDVVGLAKYPKRAADYVDKILRGSKPGDIPVVPQREREANKQLALAITTA